ncbi:MAG TPA: hypothetical protein VM733_09015 [Thermoanaerobaculia bacterium]|nr:hypothetical protein [Thermoanaerobaculia bacterium]
MGSFVNHVQIAAGPDALPRVREAVRHVAAARGLEEVNESEADRGFALVWDPDHRWITFIDEIFDSRDLEGLERAGAELSAAIGAPCVSVLVHDGEDLDVRLFAGGKRVDADRRPRGAARKWTPVVPDTAALERVWTAADLGESALEELAKLFGWNEAHAFLGFRYLRDLDGAESHIERFHFRDPNPPAHRRRVSRHLPRLWRGSKASPR